MLVTARLFNDPWVFIVTVQNGHQNGRRSVHGRHFMFSFH